MNVLSLFDGMSCGQIALERVGIKVDNYYASEIKAHGIKVTQDNYPKTIQLGDVRSIQAKDLPKIDLLIGGSPCQDFSKANIKREGLEGEKSSLFYEYLRLLTELKPKYFLLENVDMPAKDKQIITTLLGVEPVTINSRLVSAQNRVRCYWTNIPGDENTLFGNRISQPEDKKIMLSDILEEGYTDKEKSRALLESDSRPLTNPYNMIHRYINSGFTTLIFKNKDIYDSVIEAVEEGHITIIRNLDNTDDIIYRFAKDDVRYFTQTELERLQTVPEGYTKSVDRNQAASLLGDGWTVDVIAHIFKNLK